MISGTNPKEPVNTNNDNINKYYINVIMPNYSPLIPPPPSPTSTPISTYKHLSHSYNNSSISYP
jgi:hypothetical protein